MALKKTSEVIQISTQVDQGTTNAFEVTSVDLQLNPLDNEVFVVTGVKIDYVGDLPVPLVLTSPLSGRIQCEVALSTTRPTAMLNLSNSNCLAYSNRDIVFGVGDYAGNFEYAAFSMSEQGPIDTPDSNLDYIGIIATNDFFVSVDSAGIAAGTTFSTAVRLYGYRAKADAATYAALVQSEVLSS